MRPIYKVQTPNYLLETFPLGELGSSCTLFAHYPSTHALLIDPGGNWAVALEMVEAQKVQLKMILHTHGHFDHVGQSVKVREKTKAKLYLPNADLFLYQGLQEQSVFFGVQNFYDPHGIDGEIKDQSTWKVGSDDIAFTAIATPGHTPGGTCFFCNLFSPPVLIAGDTLFRRGIGRTDLPGGNHTNLLRSIREKLFTLPPETIVVAGHGPITTIGEEMEENPYLN
jgi:hydroxyacylglutathione hydrolase